MIPQTHVARSDITFIRKKPFCSSDLALTSSELCQESRLAQGHSSSLVLSLPIAPLGSDTKETQEEHMPYKSATLASAELQVREHLQAARDTAV